MEIMSLDFVLIFVQQALTETSTLTCVSKCVIVQLLDKPCSIPLGASLKDFVSSTVQLPTIFTVILSLVFA